MAQEEMSLQIMYTHIASIESAENQDGKSWSSGWPFSHLVCPCTNAELFPLVYIFEVLVERAGLSALPVKTYLVAKEKEMQYIFRCYSVFCVLKTLHLLNAEEWLSYFASIKDFLAP